VPLRIAVGDVGWAPAIAGFKIE